MLHLKMQEHSVNARNTYNIDKKGFYVSVLKRSKRVFTKASLSLN
jgi:hypothetical protein